MKDNKKKLAASKKNANEVTKEKKQPKKSLDKQKKEYRKKEYINAIITSDAGFKSDKLNIRFLSYVYAFIIFSVTLASMATLAIPINDQENNKFLFSIIEILVFSVLITDLNLRWYTANVRIKKGKISYFLFPFTLVGSILLISLLPSLYLINVWTGENIHFFNLMMGMKFLRIFRLLLLSNLVPALHIFKKVIMKEKNALYLVFSIVLMTIVIFALVIFSVESNEADIAVSQAISKYKENHPGGVFAINNLHDFMHGDRKSQEWKDINSIIKVHSLLDAFYFSTIALTTIGFGDISPITSVGKIVTIFMSIIGIAILAMPSGVIAGGFISEIKDSKKQKNDPAPKKISKKNI